MHRLIRDHGYFTSLNIYKQNNIIFSLIVFQLARRLIKMFRILDENIKKNSIYFEIKGAYFINQFSICCELKFNEEVL